ncbi:uncharacterized protein si:dkey-260g12.1 [Cololabis saira]|uniref:uncharacterized protein si:dkey-260g12.1 n=1 Tax=Cololabis saira TaxID=129043 RepID=UPI002AD4AB3A|nr:uncharacterized protein si:dkey-260g12.1 [Cololabis saira]
MGFVQYFVTVLLSAALVLSSPTRTRRSIGTPMFCPAGKYLKTDTECELCDPGSYTSENNCEESCHLCFRDCLTKYHLKVDQNCTSTSDLRCVCEPGFRCTDWTISNNCRECEDIQEDITETTTVIISGKETTSPSSFAQTEPCVSPKCGPQLDSTTAHPIDPESTNTQLAAVLSAAVFFGCVFLMILICICHSRDETCFRQTIAKLCNQEGQNTTQTLKEPSHQFPRNSFFAKQPLSCPSAANPGPVHVHNPGTVIFSLLSQFTDCQIGSTVPNGKTAETPNNEEEDERDCPVFHPTSSPSIHFSEEERSGEIDNIFFPFQEQGKECHVSKEEVL